MCARIFALPDSGADAAHRRKPALGAFMLLMHLLFDISDALSDIPAIPHTESTCGPRFPSFSMFYH